MSSIAFTGVLEDFLQGNRKTIYRAAHNKSNPYAVISNKLLRDESIKHIDRGLMCQILSWSDRHQICIKALVKKGQEGRDAIRKSLDRLIAAGYIKAVQMRSKDGKFNSVVYQVFEESTGAVLSHLDMDGVKEETQEETPQLNLFGDESMSQNQSTENGFSVNGKSEPNKYDDEINTKSSNKDPHKIPELPSKEELLNKWPKSIDDHVLSNRIKIAGLSNFVNTQERLDQFLIDFNRQHDKYKNISENARMGNFIAHLVSMKNTPSELRKHYARMQADGFMVPEYLKNKKPKEENKKMASAVDGVNPFEVKPSENLPIDHDFIASLQGF